MNVSRLAFTVVLFACLAATSPSTQPASRPVRKLKSDAPAAVRQFWNNREKSRAERIQQLNREFVGWQQALAQAKQANNQNSIAGFTNTIASNREELKDVQSAPIFYPIAHHPQQLKDGFIGFFPPSPGGKVDRYVDDQNVLLTISSGAIFKGKITISATPLWLTDYDTKNIRDDNRLSKDGKPIIIWIHGTRHYDSTTKLRDPRGWDFPNGTTSRTVPEATPFRLEDYLEPENPNG